MEAPIHRHGLEVAFGDTDASGWMHFPNVFRYFELAEHAFLKSHGLLIFDREHGGWPRVNVTCDFNWPMLAGDRIEVQLAVGRVGNTSVTWKFEIVNAAMNVAAAGTVTTVRVDGSGRPQPISDAERAALTGS